MSPRKPWERWPFASAIELELLRRSEIIMSQVEDLKAVLDAVNAKVDEVGTETGNISVQVAELIKLLQAGPTDLTEALAAATAIKAKVDAIDAVLDAIPPTPGGPTPGGPTTASKK